MPDETDILIQNHIKALPSYVRDAFIAAKPFEKIQSISVDFKLHVDEAERLQSEVLLVMLGLTPPDEFIEKTSKTFGLSDEDSTKLVDRISADLFMPIRDAMQRYIEELAQKDAADTTETAEPALSQPVQPASNAQRIVPTVTPEVAPRAPLAAPEAILAPVPPIPTIVPQTIPTPSTPHPADATLLAPQVSSTEKVVVGISPAKNTYKIDPYLEPPI